jgi:UMF1 family MFS transporter
LVIGISGTSMQTNTSPGNTPPATSWELWSWAFYDFANSGYTTVVMTTIYSAYFVGVMAADVDRQSPGSATLLWTGAIALANFIVLITGPVVGAVADHRASKKAFLLISTITCVAATALLALAAPGQLWLAFPLLVLSAIAFASGENLIAAFLPEIAASGSMGKVSGYGWSLGYFGGLLTLGLCLAYITWSSAGGGTAESYVPVTLLITAIIFALTALPTFLWLRERAQPTPLAAGGSYIREGFNAVRQTLRRASQLPDLFRFLLCLTIYQAGVATVVVVAAIYAQEVMGFDSQDLIILIMVVNFTAALGAFAFGFVQDRFGSVPSLACGLLIWIIAGLLTITADTSADFWFAGNLLGLALGATQAGGRALIGEFTPVSHSGEFFGLWGFCARTAAIIGPLSYGVISSLTQGDHRLALLSTLTFFILGLAVLLTVNESRGIADRDRAFN